MSTKKPSQELREIWTRTRAFEIKLAQRKPDFDYAYPVTEILQCLREAQSQLSLAYEKLLSVEADNPDFTRI